MDWKRIAWSLLIAGSLCLMGCGDDTTDPDRDAGPGNVDGGGGSDNCETTDSNVYVINDLIIPEEGAGMTLSGFNLDGVDSGASGDADSCFQPDFTSPSGTPGIDNQLATLAPTLESALGMPLDETIAASLADGSILILVQIDHLDNTTNDSCVDLNLMLGLVPGGGMPMVGGDGKLAPGQTFDVDPASLTAGGTPLISVERASISGGTLVATTPLINISLPVMGSNIDLNIRNANVSMTVGATTLTNGLIGGGLNVDELVTTVMNIAPDFPADTIRGVLVGVADLNKMGEECQDVSVGLEFSAVEATLGS